MSVNIKSSRLSSVSLLMVVFFFSGLASLIYQVVWQRALTLYYGVGSISTALIVSIYMLGLGIGSLIGGAISERIESRFKVYILIEFLLGCFGSISLPFLQFLGKATAGSSYFLSFVFMLSFLFFPTLLMGATLPLLTKMFSEWIRAFLRTVSLLYFLNTLGAAVGAFLASFVLISFFGLQTSVYVAAVINFLLAAMIFVAGRFSYTKITEEVQEQLFEAKETLGRLSYLLVFITGFLAIGYEIIWFRVIGILVKDSPYAFSSILGVYLIGIAIGSLLLSRFLQRGRMKEGYANLFYFLQFALGGSVLIIILGYFYLTKFTPFRGLSRFSFSLIPHPSVVAPADDSWIAFAKTVFGMFDIVFWPLFFVFIPTMIMGATFPLISKLALTDRNKEGETVGKVYFFNILGNVLGGVVTGFVLLFLLGTELTLILFIQTGLLLGLLIKPVPLLRRILYVAIVILTLLNLVLFPKKGELYATLYPHYWFDDRWTSHFEEGVEGTVMTYENQGRLWNGMNGVSHGGRPNPMFFSETVEAFSYAPHARNVLIIGFGTGTFLEMTLKSELIEKVTVVEINKSLMKNLSKISFFDPMFRDPRVLYVFDDGRRFLFRTQEKFDVVMIDPLRSATAYSNNLYSRQFYELISTHLAEKGVLLVWTDEAKITPKTLRSVFSHVRFYQFRKDYFCLASNHPFTEDPVQRESILAQFSEEERREMLRSLKFLGDQSFIDRTLQDYHVNEDWMPRAEYYLGIGDQ